MNTPRLEYQDLELPAVVEQPARKRRPRWLVAAVIALLLAGAAFAWSLFGRRQGVVFAGTQRSGDLTELMTHIVQPVDLRVTVLESGTLESAASLPVLSAVEGQVAIIRLVPDGKRVEAGEVVVELDAAALRTQETEQQIVVAKAEAAYSQALQASKMAASQAESETAAATLALEFAKLDQERFEKGDYPVQLRTQQTETSLAEEELERAQTQVKFSEELAKDGYIFHGELEADRFRMKQAQYKVEIAREKERVLQEYTYRRSKRDFESRVTEAERALERAKGLAQAANEQARAALRAQEATLNLERAKLARCADQLQKCSMRAPKPGVVVYPVPEDQDRIELFIKEGTIIRERQHVFSIADTDVLQVSTSIHEAMVNQVKSGMPARIWIDAYRGLELRGQVLAVSPLPEPGDWRRTTVKFYETKVRIDTQAPGLKPGMSAKVEVLVDEQPNVLAVPVQSVVQRGNSGVCYVLGDGPELRRLRLGKSNAEYVGVLEGLQAGDKVVLSPDLLGIPADALAQPAEAGWKPAGPGGETAAVAAAADASGQTKKFASVLAGPAGVTVEASYKVKTKGDATSSKFQIKVTGGQPGTTWEVAVDGVLIGSVTLDAAGNCEVEWNTKTDNFPANFPASAGDGTKVTVGPDYQGVLAPAV